MSTPIVGGTLDGSEWPGASPPSDFVRTQTGEAYALAGGQFVRDEPNDVTPKIVILPGPPEGNVSLGASYLPAARVGADYSLDILFQGGVAPYTSQLSPLTPSGPNSTLPDGLLFQDNGESCTIYGVAADGSEGVGQEFAVRVTDSLGQVGTRQFSLDVSPVATVIKVADLLSDVVITGSPITGSWILVAPASGGFGTYVGGGVVEISPGSITVAISKASDGAGTGEEGVAEIVGGIITDPDTLIPIDPAKPYLQAVAVAAGIGASYAVAIRIYRPDNLT